MHRTLGDGYITDLDGKNLYADEDGIFRDATQLRHQEMNAIQEEICNVIEWDGTPMNPDSETPLQAGQLNIAIDAKDQEVYSVVTNETDIKIAALEASDIGNDSNITGATVKDALDNINAISQGVFISDPSKLSTCSLLSRLAPGNAQPTQITSFNALHDQVAFKNRANSKIFMEQIFEARKILTDDGVSFSPLTIFPYDNTITGCVLNVLSKTPAPGMHLTIYAVAIGNGLISTVKSLVAIPSDEPFNDAHRTALLAIAGSSLTINDVMASYICFVQLVEWKSNTGKYAIDPFRTYQGEMELLNNFANPNDYDKYLMTASLPTAVYGSPGEFSLYKDAKVGYVFPPRDLYPYVGEITCNFSLNVYGETSYNSNGYLKFKGTSEWKLFTSNLNAPSTFTYRYYEKFTMYNPQSKMNYCNYSSTSGYFMIYPRYFSLHNYGQWF
jgi:hypothetical protein